ncbi:MAG: hypothetical protein KGS72_02565 [Cyanobacteria bacterium REEB67]|nr:hypothetical protein [Cyanobacteria bacterium REEB67]
MKDRRKIQLPAALALVSSLMLACQVQARPVAKQAMSCSNRHSTSKTSRPGPVKKLDANVALLASGAKLHREGKIEAAEVIFKQVLARDPRSVDAFYDLGAVAESRGDLIGALSNYHAALALRPNDRELKEAVHSTEVALRKAGPAALSGSPNFSLKPFTSAPLWPVTSEGTTVAPVKAASAPLTVPQAVDGEPLFAVSQPDMPPLAVDYHKFQLSSRKGEFVPPTLGVSPDQFPDIPVGFVGLGGQPGGALSTGTSACPPPTTPTLTVGQTPANHRTRQAANMILNVGVGAALGASGLHCPICHMLRFHF